jgi:hypothetical protein
MAPDKTTVVFAASLSLLTAGAAAAQTPADPGTLVKQCVDFVHHIKLDPTDVV